ncbi:MAG TPA: hypothetical protein VFB79_17900 [Candidatus Angelobacter sp.]|nr:hypothetical protein [Candidatus Angelobacter sp.]
MDMEPGVAIITGPDDWEKASLHLWGMTLADLRMLFHAVPLDLCVTPTEKVELGENIRKIVINPPIQQVSVTL